MHIMKNVLVYYCYRTNYCASSVLYIPKENFRTIEIQVYMVYAKLTKLRIYTVHKQRADIYNKRSCIYTLDSIFL